MNNIVKLLSSFFFTLCLTLNITAQNSFVNAPSASSGVATNGEDAKLNYNNGTANVTIPLVTLSDVGITYPVSLSYQTTGIRVSQPSSEIGLGWNLNAGGFISREVKGFPDDIINEIDANNQINPKYSVGFLANYSDCLDNENEYEYLDTEPDIFSFNILGHTGKFFFKKNMEIIQVNESDIKIETSFDPCLNEKITSWKITLPDATVIHFGGKGYIDSYYFETDFENPLELKFDYIPNGWHVRKIEYPNGRDLDFTYETIGAYDYVLGNNQAIIAGPSNIIEGPIQAYENIKKTIRINQIIKKIESTNYVLAFNHSNRDDLINLDGESPKRISGLELKTKDDLCLNKLSFDQDYFISDNSGIYYPEPSLDMGINLDYLFDKKRLKLNNIKVQSCTDNTEYVYDVEYYEDVPLPRRLSCSQDLWGFNNGVMDNGSLVPNIPFKTDCFESMNISTFNSVSYADRDVREDHAKAASLKKITYPNGYFNKFNYESNSIHQVIPEFKLIQEDVAPSFTDNFVELKNIGLDEFENKLQIEFVKTQTDQYTLKIYTKPSSPNSSYQLQQTFVVPATGIFSLSYITEQMVEKLNVSPDIDFDVRIEAESASQISQYLKVQYFETELIAKNTKVGGLRVSSIETPFTSKNYYYSRPSEKQEFNAPSNDKTYNFSINCSSNSPDTKSNIFIPCNVNNVTLQISLPPGQCSNNSSNNTSFSWTGLDSGNKTLNNSGFTTITETYSLFDQSSSSNEIQPGGSYNLSLASATANGTTNASAIFIFTFEDQTIYVDASPTPQSNGQLIDIPSYLALYKLPGSASGAYINDECTYGSVFRIHSSPSTTINSLNGGHIIYSKIKETIDEGQFGYTEYEFFNDENFLDEISIPNKFNKFYPLFPKVPTVEGIYLDPIAGLPKSVKVYNADSELVVESISTYESSNSTFSFSRSEKISYCQANNSDEQFTYTASTDYELSSYWVRLLESTNTEDGITITTVYQYRNDKAHHLPIQVITKNNNHSSLSTTTQNSYYAADVANDFPFRQNLIDLNAINVPLISLTEYGGRGGNKTEFSLVTKEGEQGRIIIRPKSKSTAYLDSNGDLVWKEVSRIETYQDQIFPMNVWSKFEPLNTMHVWENDLLQSSSYGNRTSTYYYDDLRRMYKSTDPIGLSNEIEEYDGFNRVTKSKTEISEGNFITNESIYKIYKNTFDEITKITTYPDSEYDIPSRTVITRIDERGLVSSVKNENYLQNGGVWNSTNIYNELGSLVRKFENDGFSTTYYSNDIRQRVERVRPKGSYNTIDYGYGTNQVDDMPGIQAGAFSKKSVTDQNGITSYIFSDIKGRKVLSVDGMGYETQYLYDWPSDLLLEVIPPESSPGNQELNYTYKYTYDFKLEEKKIPGRNIESYTYDPILERVTETTLHNGKKISYHYKDDYADFLEFIKLDGTIIKEFVPYHDNYLTDWVKEEKTRVLGTSDFLTTTFEYDDIGRASYSTFEYLDEGKDEISFIYDDMDNVRESTTIHSGNDSYMTTQYYDFDKGLRIEKSRASLPINGENKEIIIHENKYDSRDWLTEVKVNDGLHTNNYTYDLRGLIQKINSVESTTDPSDESCEDGDPPVVIPGCEGPFQINDVSLFYDCFQLSTGIPTTVSITINSSIENADGSSQDIDSNTYAFGFNGGGQNEILENPSSEENSFNNTNSGSTAQWIYSIIQDCIHQSNNPQTSLENSMILESIVMLIGDELPGDPTDPDDPFDPNAPGEYEDDISGESLFGLEIHYYDGNSDLGSVGYNNGTISWIEWKAKGEMYQAYGYQYDNNYRLTAANYKVDDPGSCYDTPTGAYNTSYSYDARGNFLSINRNGVTGTNSDGNLEFGPIDALTFAPPTGNQISSISEAADPKKGYLSAGGAYSFTNGNLISNPQISSASYNHLDLPTTITSAEGSITMIYDADGNKLKQIETSTIEGTSKKTVYMGQMEYVDNERSSLYHEGGRIMYDIDLPDEANEGAKDYEEWSISDHLGNTRIRYIDKNDDTGISINRFDEKENEVSGTYHYYPYGMVMEGNFHGQQGVIEKYQYNGIEHSSVLGSSLGLTLYRVHDAAIGGWLQVDPKSEWGYNMSPYNSMQNNPIGYSDPDGDWIHIAAGAVIGGIINTATHWDEIKKDGLWAGVKAFGIGAGAGALTAATGVGIVGAGLAKGAVIGAGSGIAGDIFLQTGNMLAFNDQFNPTQTLFAGAFGAVTGGLTGHLTKAKTAITSNGGKGTFEIAEGTYRKVKGSIREDWIKQIGKEGLDEVEIHHIIPKSIYEDFPELAKYFDINDAIQNGIPLPKNWHWKHPAYTKWVEDGLKHLRSTSGINASTVGQLRSSAIFHLNQGVNSTSNTINQFWQNASHILPYGL